MPSIFHWLRTNYRPGEPVFHLCDPVERNRVNNILQDIQGIGCRIEKPIDRNGRGWRIVVDGSSDDEPPPDYSPPGAPVLDEVSVDWNASNEVEINGWSTEDVHTIIESYDWSTYGVMARPPKAIDDTYGPPVWIELNAMLASITDWSGITLTNATINVAWNSISDADDFGTGQGGYFPRVAAADNAIELISPATAASSLLVAAGGITTSSYYVLDNDGVKRAVTIADGIITGISGYTP